MICRWLRLKQKAKPAHDKKHLATSPQVTRRNFSPFPIRPALPANPASKFDDSTYLDGGSSKWQKTTDRDSNSRPNENGSYYSTQIRLSEVRTSSFPSKGTGVARICCLISFSPRNSKFLPTRAENTTPSSRLA